MISKDGSQNKTMELQLALAFYNAARAELDNRQKMRDTTLGLYVAASGTVFGYTFESKMQSAPSYFIMIIPVLCLFTSLMTSVHTRLIGASGQYCAGTLQETFSRLGLGRVVQWDKSQELKLVQHDTVVSRSRAFLIIIILPSLFAIITIIGKCPLKPNLIYQIVVSRHYIELLPFATQEVGEWLAVIITSMLFTYLSYRTQRHATRGRQSMYRARFRSNQ